MISVQNGTNSYNLQFLAKQVQANPAFFRMLLPLKIVFADSTDTLVQVMNTNNDQLFSFTFQKQPVRLVFDPDTNIMLKEGSTNLGIIEITGIQFLSHCFKMFRTLPGNKTDIPYFLEILCMSDLKFSISRENPSVFHSMKMSLQEGLFSRWIVLNFARGLIFIR